MIHKWQWPSNWPTSQPAEVDWQVDWPKTFIYVFLNGERGFGIKKANLLLKEGFSIENQVNENHYFCKEFSILNFQLKTHKKQTPPTILSCPKVPVRLTVRPLAGFSQAFWAGSKMTPLSGTLRILYANRHSQYNIGWQSCQVNSLF